MIQEYKDGKLYTRLFTRLRGLRLFQLLRVCSATPSSTTAMSSRSWNESSTRSRILYRQRLRVRILA